MSPTPVLRPEVLTGYDLSTVSATLIGETSQQTAGTVPTVNGRVLRANLTYRISLGASLESEQDIPDLLGKMFACIRYRNGSEAGC